MENHMEGGSMLSPEEQALFAKFIVKNPGITPADFKELRGYALKTTGGSHKFFEVAGVIMEEKPDMDTLKEMHANADNN